MVHDHARGLHKGVADGRSDKGEAALFQGLAHGLGFGRHRRHLATTLEVIDLRRPADKRPKQFHRVLQRQPGRGVAPGGIEFQTVADDPGIEHQILDFGVAQLRHALYIETEQHLAITGTLFQNGDPGQPRLEPFEQQ